MKKISILLIYTICVALTLLALSACSPTITYSLNSPTDFLVTFGTSSEEWLDDLLENSFIEESVNGQLQTTIPVTQDMIVEEESDLQTNTVGVKTITISHAENTFSIEYSVKYKVDFSLDGQITNTQHVFASNEIQKPEDPSKTDHTFDSWQMQNGQAFNFEQPDQITSNLTLTAVFAPIAIMQTGEIFTWETQGTIDFSQDKQADCSYSVVAQTTTGDSAQNLLHVELNEQTNIITYTFVDESFIGDVVIVFKAERNGFVVSEKRHTIHRYATPTIAFSTNNESIVLNHGENKPVSCTISAHEDLAVSCEVTALGSTFDFQKADAQNIVFLMLRGTKAGYSTLTFKISNSHNPAEYVQIQKTIFTRPSDFSIAESAQNVNYGIEGLRSFARTNVNGDVERTTLTLSLGAQNTVDDTFVQNVTWHSNHSFAQIENGVITLSQTNEVAIVSFFATFSYQGVEFSSREYQMRCVFNGVNVYSYSDLLTATKQEKIVVLQQDIIDDFGYINGEMQYEEINSTYDVDYYLQKPEIANRAKIKVLLQFKNDVYGNGKIINAHNLTSQLLDATGALTENSIFRGPLNFVSMTTSESSSVSVKGQDNVCFAVYENVKLNNVELRGSNLDSTQNTIDLTDLDYSGTTVEVFGDNVTIEYCRINNGRTVLRIFGDIQDKTKAIHTTITNSVLSCAREFILRIGTNCFIQGDFDNPSPTIGEDTTSFPKQLAYSEMTEQQKQSYDETYVKTFVTVKNCVFQNAGIFAIGLDSHFSGRMLADGERELGNSSLSALVSDWKNLAKTSYGAKLTFEGDVRIYDWKPLSSVDSSTLIECLDDTFRESLSFDVRELVASVANQERFKHIVCTYNEEQYVHGGIAFFGGGKNYSVFEDKNYTFHTLRGYSVSLREVNRELFERAAGTESFYFLLHDASGLGSPFLPQDQEALLKSDLALSNVYQK